ncbi:MAG: hypothetical protein ACPGOV_05670 [Magnetovibrionaceae bacterium]
MIDKVGASGGWALRVVQNDDIETANAFGSDELAERIWARAVDRALDASKKLNYIFLLELYQLGLEEGQDLPDEAATKALIAGGGLTRDRWMRLRPPKSIASRVSFRPPGQVTEKLIMSAQEIINEKGKDFPDWVLADLESMNKLVTSMEAAQENEPEKLLDLARELFSLSYKVRGQGGTYGFALVSEVCTYLCRMVESLESFGPREVETLRVHVDALKVVVVGGFTGDGGPQGEALIESLKEVHTRVLGS